MCACSDSHTSDASVIASLGRWAYSGVDARKLIHEHVIPEGSKVVDLCCGVGFSSARNARVTGVDTSDEMLSIARLRRRDVDAFIHGNAETWGADQCCEMVTLARVARLAQRACLALSVG